MCAILAGHPDYPHHDVYEDAATIAFLARPATLIGSCIVAPRRHVEDWVSGMGEEEYLALQRVVHRVAGAVAAVVPVERMYCLSLGSQQGNAHLHWHLAPLPPECPMSGSSITRSWRKTASWTSPTARRRTSPGPSGVACDRAAAGSG